MGNGTKFVTMGEIMLRMTRPDYQRIIQGSKIDGFFGGSEANVAISLAQMGDDVEYVTRLPNNMLGVACRNELRRFNVGTKHIIWGGTRLGKYFYEQAASLRGLEQGVVRIGSFNSVSSSLLPRAIQRFKQLHPAIRFELHQGLYQELEGLVRGGVVDFSFTDLCRPTEFAARELFEDAYLAVLPMDHPLLRFDPIPRAEFVREPFILLDEGRGGATLRVFLAEHPDLDVQYRVGDDYSVLNMVENRLGVAVLPEMVARHAPSGVAVRQLLPPLRRRVGVIFRKETELSAAARAFLDVLDEVIADS